MITVDPTMSASDLTQIHEGSADDLNQFRDGKCKQAAQGLGGFGMGGKGIDLHEVG